MDSTITPPPTDRPKRRLRGPQLFWFGWEVQYLRDHWAHVTPTEIATHLRRSLSSVRSKARQLGLRRQRPDQVRWNDQRRARLMTLVKRSPREAAREFGLAEVTVLSYVRRWTRKKTQSVWTAAEIELVGQMYTRGRIDELLQLLPHRSLMAIRLCASRRFGATLRRRLTAEERAILAQEYPTADITELAQRLGIAPGSVRAHASRNGIRRAG